MEQKKPETKIRKPKIISIQCHQGVTLAPGGAGTVKNGISIRDPNHSANFELELHPAGVIISFTGEHRGKGKLVPYTNITQCDVEFEE